MRIIVDEMPTEPRKCPYCVDKSTMDYDEYVCTFREEHKCYCTDGNMSWCPYFIDFKTCFDCEIQRYDTVEKDPYRWG